MSSNTLPKHPMKLRERKEKVKSDTQQAFDNLDSILDYKMKDTDYKFAKGSLVYLKNPNTQWQKAHPVLFIEKYVNGDALFGPRYWVSHIDCERSVLAWNNNNDAKPVKATIPNSIKGGTGVVTENEVELLVSNPGLDVNHTIMMILRLIQHRLIKHCEEEATATNKLDKAAIQTLFDLLFLMHNKLSEQACIREQIVKISIADQLIPSLILFLKSKNIHLVKNKDVYCVSGNFSDLAKFCPPQYMHYTYGKFEYRPHLFEMKINTSWKNDIFRIRFTCIKMDDKGTIINVCQSLNSNNEEMR